MNRLFTLILCLVLAHVSAMAESIIPEYDQVSSTPANEATVRSITSVSIDMSREGFDAPIGLMPGAEAVTATADGQNIEGVSAAVKGGQLVVSFSAPYVEKSVVTIHVPAGITNNLALPVATMTPEEIAQEGGCTNPAIDITLHVEPIELPVRDVTGIGFNAKYLQDEEGNYLKNEKGQYIRVDEYKSLIDAQLQPADEKGNGGDRVTVMYFWYDEEFQSIDYQGGASVTNLTTGTPINIASVTFKTGGDSYRNNVIELRLSTENYIYSDKQQGVYEVTLPSGIAVTADGIKNQGKTFRFTFGDPGDYVEPEEINLALFEGNYKMMMEPGEELEDGQVMETFQITEIEGQYYVTHLCGSSLQIPLVQVGKDYVLKFTESGDEAFMSATGGDVTILLQEKDGSQYIYLEQYGLYKGEEVIVGGERYFERDTYDCIRGLQSTTSNTLYDLAGRRLRHTPQRGIVIKNGKKVIL